jgi:membrane-anchored protein YejM (alkaline phosphatase superfamily)
MTTVTWALALDVGAGLAVFVVLSLAMAIAAARRRAFAWEYAFAVVLMGAAITEFVRRLVLPSIAFTAAEAAVGAIPFGAVMALMWSGWRVRQSRRDRPPETAMALLSAVFDGRSIRSVLFVCVVPVAAAIAFRQVEQVDWALNMNRLIVVLETGLIFAFFLGRFRDRQDDSWSNRRLVAAPLTALVVLSALPYATTALVAATGNPHLESELALERLPTTDPLGAIVARLWIEQQPPNMDYYHAMTASNLTQSAQRPAVPAPNFTSTPIDVRAPLPHVFIFLIDSLRRDYLSPYNPAVSFTPAIANLAADSYVFRNAFTGYGGTWMSIPSMWTGTPLTRGWGRVFKEMNALEPLINTGGFDFAINDYTVATVFSTPQTFLNPGIESVQTDICDNVKALQAHIDRRAAPLRPLFTFLAPMNVHILNTRNAAADPADPRYSGFYPGYAARLERADACLGSFLAYLHERGLYDNSIIILASDHGESLGTDGNWGHQFFLFPEDVRIPLIVRLPPAMRERFTTDLARVTLLRDVAPTLLALLGQPVPDLGEPFGAALFVPPDREPRPRRRESFLLMSSYGSTFAIIRRNGKFLYISDLVNWREYAYTLFREPLGERVPVTETLRRAGQADIIRKMDEVEALFRAK